MAHSLFLGTSVLLLHNCKTEGSNIKWKCCGKKSGTNPKPVAFPPKLLPCSYISPGWPFIISWNQQCSQRQGIALSFAWHLDALCQLPLTLSVEAILDGENMEEMPPHCSCCPEWLRWWEGGEAYMVHWGVRVCRAVLPSGNACLGGTFAGAKVLGKGRVQQLFPFTLNTHAALHCEAHPHSDRWYCPHHGWSTGP